MCTFELRKESNFIVPLTIELGHLQDLIKEGRLGNKVTCIFTHRTGNELGSTADFFANRRVLMVTVSAEEADSKLLMKGLDNQ